MNNRERLLSIINGQSPDRIPWIPRLEIWYEAHKRLGTLPEKFVGNELREIEKYLRVGTAARDGRVFHIEPYPEWEIFSDSIREKHLLGTEFYNIEIRIRHQGNDIITEYITPVGTVSTLHRRTEQLERIGIRSLEVEHIIKRAEDYPVVEYLIQHAKIIPTYEDYQAYDEEIGGNGLPIVYTGPDPMFRILNYLIGYNNAFFHLHDYPDQFHHLLDTLNEQAKKIQQVILDSPAKIIWHGTHFDSQMTPPPIFRQYMLPYYQAFAERLHERGKVLACHADADTSHLLDLIKESGFDIVDCFVTAPMVPVTLEAARMNFGNDVIIWGGIPSVMLSETVSDVDFDTYMLELFRTIAPGDAFILGVADNVMPDSKIERVEQVSEMVEEYGGYPIQIN